MPVYRLSTDNIDFPHPSQAHESGLLAVGGDLSAERLINAYSNGIFPWNSHGEILQWWSPVPRLLLYPREVHISKSMRSFIRQRNILVTYDNYFSEVLKSCANIERKGQIGTWLHKDLEEALINLHELGLAHSVEVFHHGELVGGLYGISIGRMFCGESMFARESNMSKIALIYLCQLLDKLNYQFIDCQQITPHLVSMGAKPVNADTFFNLLELNKQCSLNPGLWKERNH
ncbi:MAG: leucyl/phenylalanyl-tRNA--protein transferase [Saprospiraceae bacterium]|nr:leucyl/phenylalanyl-tRNA--protein transferase [Saprospiraceae bacterium]HMX87659.1 leucyl/phenylalanyl-tRNA--protein transferase [Saprospiraceae bacterium]HMZ39474.1 leucyl/phenylalanyl-tRNA--protein transferase [Saprospiraceae bacterium]HNA63260.1 leucyl/phenylalanyl-tRNA--protein transferase [Saprospiraceae bacterium]HNB29471.1 leucyl/phenylalanyl-tRNA--protein transferase [Saprospiraceae bacterium]